MTINFKKYHGTGNDFIMIDGYNSSVEPVAFTPEIVAQLCHRHFGIGADGLIILMPHDTYDFEMVYYNSDGHRATMCGNGGRCILHFAHSLGVIKNETKFLAADGPHEGKIDDMISLSMNVKGNVEQKGQSEYFLDTGSPHYMVFTDNLNELDIIKSAHTIRYNDEYKREGTNVNFVESNSDHIEIRTYERGVEGETLSCGTGIVASALTYASLNGIEKGIIDVNAVGGSVKVDFTKEGGSYQKVWLIGPAVKVYEGTIVL